MPETGEILHSPDWADTLKALVRAEDSARGKGRIAGIEAARNAFYEGEIAARIVDFSTTHPVRDASGREHTGLLTYADIAEWHATVEEPVMYTYHGLDVYKCPGWTQGPVFVQQLALLAGYDLPAMGHNSAEYLHTLAEVAKLAFADREAYYGDPRFDSAPYDVLLSEPYNAARRGLIGPTASRELRPGDAGRGLPSYATFDIRAANRRALGWPEDGSSHAHAGDTTHMDAMDREGNVVACTPSGGWIWSSPVIPGLGFPLGSRGQMFYLDATRPNALAPHKRPRATLTPTIALKDGEPYLAFGTPGGDCQDQWTLQFFLNYVDFGMNLQQALEAPTVHSEHFPSSFYPRPYYPARLIAEGRIPAEVRAELERRGHEVIVVGDWSNGKPMGIYWDRAHGVIQGAASPKGIIGYAMGW